MREGATVSTHNNTKGIVRAFDAAWRKARLGHAYLFVGQVGVGKHTLARELARALLCETPSKALQACW